MKDLLESSERRPGMQSPRFSRCKYKVANTRRFPHPGHHRPVAIENKGTSGQEFRSLQEFRSRAPRAANKYWLRINSKGLEIPSHSATPELLQLLTPSSAIFPVDVPAVRRSV